VGCGGSEAREEGTVGRAKLALANDGIASRHDQKRKAPSRKDLGMPASLGRGNPCRKDEGLKNKRLRCCLKSLELRGVFISNVDFDKNIKIE